MSNKQGLDIIEQIVEAVTARVLAGINAQATTQTQTETQTRAPKRAKQVVKVNTVPTNAEINAVRKDRDALRSMTKRSASDERELERIEAQLFAMRRAYHAHLKERRAAKQAS